MLKNKFQRFILNLKKMVWIVFNFTNDLFHLDIRFCQIVATSTYKKGTRPKA